MTKASKVLSAGYSIENPIYDPRFVHTRITGLNNKMGEFFEIVRDNINNQISSEDYETLT